MRPLTRAGTRWPPTPWPPASKRPSGSTQTSNSILTQSSACAATICRSPAAFTPARARALGSQTLPGTAKLGVGKGGGLCEILYAGAGFLHVRREVYQNIQEKLALPVCNERFGRPMVPFFQPMVHRSEAGAWYLAEDYAFCERARQCGYKIMADTSIRLWHIGEYGYGWEDAGQPRARHDSFLFVIDNGKPGEKSEIRMSKAQTNPKSE